MAGYMCSVGNLSYTTTETTLKIAFNTYGEILECKIIYDRETGQSRGAGFVTFSTEEAMKAAIEGLNGQMLDRRVLTVKESIRVRRGSGASS